MAIVTPLRLAQEIKKLLDGGDPPIASNISFGEIKISIGQVINQLLKIDYFQTNLAMGEKIPNGSVLALYEGIAVESWNGKSRATLPIKPLKLPRNMGVYAIYPNYHETVNSNYELDKEFIPLQMGQGALIKSQPMINDILGQVGYETFGDTVIFTKDIKEQYPQVELAMRLAIMDISQYGDYDILPILPEMEWQIKQEVVKMYSSEPIPDKLVDSTNKENKQVPVIQQQQSS